MKENKARIDAEADSYISDEINEREQRIRDDIYKLFKQSWWVYKLGAFPDGQPLVYQHPIKVEIYEMFIMAFDKLMAPKF